MMTRQDRQILNQFVEKVRLKIPDAQIWAFGSRVRGEAKPDSDLDICVVTDNMSVEQREVVDCTA